MKKVGKKQGKTGKKRLLYLKGPGEIAGFGIRTEIYK